ncbi:MAG: hypothetical protein ABIG89_07195 [Candidatus Woesearchaeota archaeon]
MTNRLLRNILISSIAFIILSIIMALIGHNTLLCSECTLETLDDWRCGCVPFNGAHPILQYIYSIGLPLILATGLFIKLHKRT